MCDTKEPWYDWASRTKPYLHHRILYRRRFPAASGDHAHCEVCWARIGNGEGDSSTGYYEPDTFNWICRVCAQELRTVFDWTLAEDGPE